MINDQGVIQPQQENDPNFYSEVISWCHQCWQLYKLGHDIDLDEFKRRLNVNEIDYRQFKIDHAEELQGDGLIILLRVLNVLYPEEFTDPDKE